MSKELLVVFAKNLLPGTVKTRLAADIGMDLAMEVYKELVAYTAEVADKVKTSKAVYYSEYVELYDFFHDEKYSKHIQEGNDLGQRMLNAFYDAFEGEYDKMVLIGSDTPDISKKIIDEAFQKLDDHDAVVGPAEDGGYYLIGLKQAYPQLFEGKEYSHDKVLEELLEEAEELELKVAQLKTLFDVDTKADMKKAGIEIVYEDDADVDLESGEDYSDDY